MSSPESESPPAGWYADSRGGHRWWDGEGWTQHRQSDDGVVWTDSAADVQAATSASPVGTLLGLVAAVALFFSTFSRWMTTTSGEAYNAYDTGLPWIVTGANYDPVFEAGMFAHGLLLAALAIVGLILVIRASQGRIEGGHATLVGVFVIMLVLLNAFAFRGAFSSLNEARSSSVGIGIGLWIAFASGVALIASGLMISPRQ